MFGKARALSALKSNSDEVKLWGFLGLQVYSTWKKVTHSESLFTGLDVGPDSINNLKLTWLALSHLYYFTIYKGKLSKNL